VSTTHDTQTREVLALAREMGARLVPGAASDGELVLDASLREWCAAGAVLDEQRAAIDMLCRKLEVVRCLRTRYRRSDGRAAAGAGTASPATVDALLSLCLVCFVTTGDLRYLNTVVKAQRVGLLEPAGALDPRTLALAGRLLEKARP